MKTIDVMWPWSFVRYVTLIAVRFYLLTYLLGLLDNSHFNNTLAQCHSTVLNSTVKKLLLVSSIGSRNMKNK